VFTFFSCPQGGSVNDVKPSLIGDLAVSWLRVLVEHFDRRLTLALWWRP
jgi:hypothetical protein